MEKEKKKKQQGLFEAYLIPMTSRLLKIPYLRAIRESVYVMMPIIMMLALINMVGNLVLNRTAIPAASDEEIIEYLISSDITLAQIEDYLIINE